MTDKIVFLDCDGVMIPATQLLIDRQSDRKRIFPATTIAAMNELCKRSGAKIVFNTSHNNPLPGVPDIEVAMVNYGLLPEYIHPTDNKTRYPSLERSAAIKDWLSRHPEVEDDWVAIDDVQCADREHLILVDPSSGIDIDDVNCALMILGGDLILIFL